MFHEVSLFGIAVLAFAALDTGIFAQQEHSVWSGVYTEQQATDGATVYTKACASCHGEELSGEGFAPPLIDEPFALRWQDGTVDDLFVVLKATMPQDRPASLSDAEYAALIAFLLQKNQAPAGPAALPSDRTVLKMLTFKRP